MPAGPMPAGLSAGAGLDGGAVGLVAAGLVVPARLPGAPKPAVAMPRGRKIRSRVRSSHDLPATFSAMCPAMA